MRSLHSDSRHFWVRDTKGHERFVTVWKLAHSKITRAHHKIHSTNLLGFKDFCSISTTCQLCVWRIPTGLGTTGPYLACAYFLNSNLQQNVAYNAIVFVANANLWDAETILHQWYQYHMSVYEAYPHMPFLGRIILWSRVLDGRPLLFPGRARNTDGTEPIINLQPDKRYMSTEIYEKHYNFGIQGIS